MELEFSLQEADLQALVRHQIQQSPLVPRRITQLRLGYTLGFGLLALGAYLTLPDPTASHAFAPLSVASFIFYPTLARRRLHANIPRIVRDKIGQSSLGKRTLRALPDRLEQLTPNAKSTVSSRVVGPVETTPTHAFIAIDGVYTVVIPTAAIPADALAGFLEADTNYRKAAA